VHRRVNCKPKALRLRKQNPTKREIAARIAHAIQTYAPDARPAYTLRDRAIRSSLKAHAGEVTAEVDRIASLFADTEFGKPTLDGLRNGDQSRRHAARDLLGGVTAEIAADVAYNLFEKPKNPKDSAVCIRYLSPEKWLWLLDQRSIRFSNPSTFATDAYDSMMPNVVLEEVIVELYKRRLLDGADIEWIDYAAGHWFTEQSLMRGRYRVSCWNLFDRHTSHLMWNQFAGGHYGAALLCKYGKLRDAMETLLTEVTVRDVEWIGGGLVSYDKRRAVEPLFFKRPEYKDEREVRFVAHAIEGNELALPLSYLINDLTVICPPDAGSHHCDAVFSTWDALRKSIQPLVLDAPN
jgi:hypothetical protein